MSFEGEGVAAVTRQEAREQAVRPCRHWDLPRMRAEQKWAGSVSQPLNQEKALPILICLRAYASPSQGPKMGICSKSILLPHSPPDL